MYSNVVIRYKDMSGICDFVASGTNPSQITFKFKQVYSGHVCSCLFLIVPLAPEIMTSHS